MNTLVSLSIYEYSCRKIPRKKISVNVFKFLILSNSKGPPPIYLPTTGTSRASLRHDTKKGERMTGKSRGKTRNAVCLSYSQEALLALFWGSLGALMKRTEQLCLSHRKHLSGSGLSFSHPLTCSCICRGLFASLKNDPFITDYLGGLSALMVSWKTMGYKPLT